MTTRLRIGFLPLIDAALLVVAREEGFAEQEGLSLDLVREASWANLRDRLSVGLLDAAQMLAPAAIAATLVVSLLAAAALAGFSRWWLARLNVAVGVLTASFQRGRLGGVGPIASPP